MPAHRKYPKPIGPPVDFGAATRAARKAVSLTLEKAAGFLDLSSKFLGEVELGKKHPSFKTIMEMATLYGVQPGDFFRYFEPRDAEGWIDAIVKVLRQCPSSKLRLYYRVLIALHFGSGSDSNGVSGRLEVVEEGATSETLC